jgi:hypothetical protein
MPLHSTAKSAYSNTEEFAKSVKAVIDDTADDTALSKWLQEAFAFGNNYTRVMGNDGLLRTRFVQIVSKGRLRRIARLWRNEHFADDRLEQINGRIREYLPSGPSV